MTLSPVSPGILIPPIAIAGRDVVVQPGETVLLDGIESMAQGEAEIAEYSWSLERGDTNVVLKVNTGVEGSPGQNQVI